MQSLGNFIERLGPAFGGAFFALVVGVMLALFAVSIPRLIKREA